MTVALKPGWSYLVASAAEADELTSGVAAIDRVVADSSGLGVKELRTLLSQAKQRPFGESRLLLLYNADELSVILQTTLLKLVEEPPSYLLLVLQGARAEALLPTLRSRLHQVRPSGSGVGSKAAPEAAAIATLEQLPGKNRQQALGIIRQLENQEQQRQPLDPNLLELLAETRERLEANCNVRLSLLRLLLRSRALSGME